MPYKTGKAKSLDDITLEDVLSYPIWEWALDEEGEEGLDETRQRPVIDKIDVTEEIDSPIISLKVKETGGYASGEYDHEGKLIRAIAFWDNNSWTLPHDYSQSGFPLTLISLASIEGQSGCEFIYLSPEEDEALLNLKL
jgi:hypothetical protein